MEAAGNQKGDALLPQQLILIFCYLVHIRRVMIITDIYVAAVKKVYLKLIIFQFQSGFFEQILYEMPEKQFVVNNRFSCLIHQ